MSDGPRLEVAEVFRQFSEEYLTKYGASVVQRRALRDLQVCRTAALGGHLEACDHCGHQRPAYNSCRNRHCPKCQAMARAHWMQAREAELLPTPYFHVVFTLPEALGPLALQNPAVVYGVLFRAVSETLLQVAANPKHLGAKIGFMAVLHTWGQNLMHHPHVHCVVPAGGFAIPRKDRDPCANTADTSRSSTDNDNTAWVHGRGKFFLPVRVLSRVFRGKFIDFLKQAARRGKLTFHGKLASLANPRDFEQLLNQAVRHDWVVYAKRPFGGPRQVLKYLARYTHRVAISNRRLLRFENGQVTFSWKDYAHGNQQSTMTLAATEFMRRFLLHVLPTSFVKIRYYGFMANRGRKANIALARTLLGQSPPAEAEPETEAKLPLDEAHPTAIPDAEPTKDTIPPERGKCPVCEEGRMRIIARIERPSRSSIFSAFSSRSPPRPQPPDTS